MKPSEKVTLCDSLAIIILSRLLKRNGQDVTENDLETIEKYIEEGVRTFTEKLLHNVITLTGLTGNRTEYTKTMLPYINTNQKVRFLMDKLEEGYQHVFIRVEKAKVVCSYVQGDRMEEISFSVVASKSEKVFGIGHVSEDYGFAVHKDYMEKLFDITLPTQIRYDYLAEATNEGKGATHASVQKATSSLYEWVAREINQRNHDTFHTEYLRFFHRLAYGLHAKYQSDDDFEVDHCADCKVVSINYDTLFAFLNVIKINANLAERKIPTFDIIDWKTNKLIFRIKMKSEKNEDSPTGRKYTIYFQTGDIMSFIMQNNKTEKL